MQPLSRLLFTLCIWAAVSAGHAAEVLIRHLDLPTLNADKPSISADGRYLAYRGIDFTQGNRQDIYLDDLVANTHQLLSQTAAGVLANGNSDVPVISKDGRYVIFTSNATNLGVPIGGVGLFLFDRINQQLSPIFTGPSNPTTASAALTFSTYAGISATGQFVAYRLAFPNSVWKIYVRDTVSGTSVDSGAPSPTNYGATNAHQLSISSDGRYFSRIRAPGPTYNSNQTDMVVFDRSTGLTAMANVNNNGVRGAGGNVTADMPTLSNSGRIAAFSSMSTLTSGDTDGGMDVFVHDFDSGLTERLSFGTITAGSVMPHISPDGRYVVFYGAGKAGGPQSLQVHDRVTKTATPIVDASTSINYPVISAMGRYVAYSIGNVPGYSKRSLMAIADLGPPAGVTVSATSLAVTEGAAAATYSVVLDRAPTADVIVKLPSSTQLAVSPLQLTFTAASWSTPQVISVSALQDNIVEGPQTETIRHTIESDDLAYRAVTPPLVEVAIKDIVIPTIGLAGASGAVWTQADLNVIGTAAPGVTVVITAANGATGAMSAVSTVADAQGNWARTITGLGDGAYTLQADADSVKSAALQVDLDSHAPVSVLTLSPTSPLSGAGWYAAPVLATLSAGDGIGGQGVQASEYQLDAAALLAFPASGVEVKADGSHSLCYRSVDFANQIELLRCATVAIDTVAPLASPVFTAANGSLELNAFDGGSGLLPSQISLDGGTSWTVLTGPLVFHHDGSYDVRYRLTDKAGNTMSDQTSVIVATAPQMTAPADQGAQEAVGKEFALGAFTDQNEDSPWTVEVLWGDGSAATSYVVTASGSLGTRAHAYADNGSYLVSVKVTDAAGTIGETRFAVVVSNVAPTAQLSVGGTSSGPVIEGVTFALELLNAVDASSADLQAGLHYAFACDGSALTTATYVNSGTSNSMMCAFVDNGTGMVRARVIDKDGGFTEYSAVTDITSSSPNAFLTVTGPVAEGGSVTLSLGKPSDTSPSDIQAGFHYAFSCDGSALTAATYANSPASATATCTYPDNGTQMVRARIIDKDGAFSDYSAVVAVANVAPTATLTASGNAIEGAPVLFALTDLFDPSRSDIDAGLHFAFACDGAPLTSSTYASSGNSASSTCVFQSGPQTVRARVIDKDGDFTEYTMVLVVADAVPTTALRSNGPVAEGSRAMLTFVHGADASGLDKKSGLHYAFACDGASLEDATYANSGNTPTAPCVYADGPNVQVARARVIDTNGSFTDYTVGVVVNNVAPVLGAIAYPGASVAVGASANITAGFTDAGVLDTHTGAVDWGDGTVTEAAVSESSGNGSLSAAHIYSVAGVFKIKVCLTDKDGASVTAPERQIAVVESTQP